MASVGCLVLHGFTSCADSVNRVPVRLAAHGIPYRMPVLRGHHTRPEDLVGVTWHDWFADASAAYRDLLREVERVIVIGLSMGGLVSLHLTAANPATTAGVVAVAPALRFFVKRPHLIGQYARVYPMWGDETRDMGLGWADPELGRRHGNYRRFPTLTFGSLYRYSQVVERQLPRVSAPALIIHSRADKTIPGEASEIIFERISSQDKQLVWFERSGHEMLRDAESPAVLDAVEQFVLRIAAQEELSARHV